MTPMKKQIMMIIFIFSTVAVLMMGISLLQSEIMNSVRSYVRAEGLYSKGQKDAVYFLVNYIQSGDHEDYENFNEALKIPLGAHKARLAMLSESFDYLGAYQGFLQLQSHPQDINGLIWFFRYFKTFPYMAEGVEIWYQADQKILQLATLATKVRKMVDTQTAITATTLAQIEQLNRQLAALETDFSLTLSAGSRWVKSMLAWTGTIIFGLTMILAFFLSQRIWQDIDHARRQLIESKNKLKEQNHIQKQLFSIIGHELRTPAATLKMLMDNDPQLDGQYPETLGHMLNILDDMSVVTNPERAIQGKHSVTSIKRVLDDLVVTQNRLIMERGMHLQIELDEAAEVNCYFNAQLLRQIILNLIKNSALHGFASRMLIKVNSLTQSRSQRLTVKMVFEDNGKGIAEQYHQDLFKAFSRADSAEDGTGLGLYLSQKFAREALDGDLVFDPGFESGCRFILTMDLLLAGNDTDEAQPKVEQALLTLTQPLTIVYAEDNELMREITAEMLTKLGAQVSAFKNGELALSYLKQHQDNVDLLLTDAFMPQMDGFELIKNARQAGFVNTIIGATAATVGDEMQQLIDSGADFALEKPIEMKRLLQILESR